MDLVYLAMHNNHFGIDDMLLLYTTFGDSYKTAPCPKILQWCGDNTVDEVFALLRRHYKYKCPNTNVRCATKPSTCTRHTTAI